MTDRRPFSAQEKLDAVEREVRYRRTVYARRIEAGKMTKELAAKQIAIFNEIADDYRKLAAAERLL